MLSLMQSMMTKANDEKPDYSNYLAYLKAQKYSDLRVVAARAKVGEGELRDIVAGITEIDEDMALHLALVTEPMDDQWALDPEHALDDVPDLTNGQIRQRLQLAENNGKLGLIANLSGVKGGEETLREILNRPTTGIDPITRMMLLNVME
jgi:hypothetical protein